MTPLAFDPERYREYLDDYELTEQQENELLEALWNILWTFADMGFGLDSVQLFTNFDDSDIQHKKASTDTAHCNERSNANNAVSDEKTSTDSVNSLEIKEPLNHQSMAEKFCTEAQTVEDTKGGQP